MKGRDFLKTLILAWAAITIPFFVLGYGFSLSFDGYVKSLVSTFFRVDSIGKLISNIFFFAPWLMIVVWVLHRVVTRTTDRET